MERLTAYSYGEILILVLLASLVLIAQSAALCWALAHLPRRRIRYLLPETAALAVVLLTTLLLGGAWKLFFAELPPIGWLAAERWTAGLLSLVVGLTACERRLLPALLLAFAGLCSLPMMDDFLPMSAALVLLLLGVRLVLLAARARARMTREVTVSSIRAGLDLLPEGILFAREDHAAVLVNITMLRFMERLFGRQYRNAAVFWQDLTAFDAPAVAEKRQREGTVLLRFAAGDVWLVQRVQLLGALPG